MLRIIVTLNGLLLVLAGAVAQDDAGKKELEKVQGDWKLLAGSDSGQPFPENALPEFKFTIKGSDYEFHAGEEVEKGTLKFNRTAKPAELDVDIKEGAYKGMKQLGIYELAGTKLKLCLARPGEMKRPTKFSTSTEDKNIFFEFEMMKK